MNALEKFIRSKGPMRDILAKLLLEMLEKEKQAKREGRNKGFEGVYRLTPRQIQVTKLLLDGHSYAEIAKELFIAVHTVRCHARRAYIVLGVKGRWDLESRISEEEADLIRRRFELVPK
jgi:DNA-binding CsgD family transcriptional regulator